MMNTRRGYSQSKVGARSLRSPVSDWTTPFPTACFSHCMPYTFPWLELIHPPFRWPTSEELNLKFNTGCTSESVPNLYRKGAH